MHGLRAEKTYCKQSDPNRRTAAFGEASPKNHREKSREKTKGAMSSTATPESPARPSADRQEIRSSANETLRQAQGGPDEHEMTPADAFPSK
jgi:hypothetical protein